MSIWAANGIGIARTCAQLSVVLLEKILATAPGSIALASALHDVEQRAWILRSDHKQCARRTRGRAATLLPVLKRAHRDSEKRRPSMSRQHRSGKVKERSPEQRAPMAADSAVLYNG